MVCALSDGRGKILIENTGDLKRLIGEGLMIGIRKLSSLLDSRKNTKKYIKDVTINWI